MDRMRTVDEHIGEWRAYLLRQKAVQNMDIEKLEDYPRADKILGERAWMGGVPRSREAPG